MEFVVNYCHAMVIGPIVQQDRQCTYTRNHFCRGKAISIIYSESIFVALVFQRAEGMRLLYSIRDLSGHTIVSHIISSPSRFSG